jgi:hypothetical protein
VQLLTYRAAVHASQGLCDMASQETTAARIAVDAIITQLGMG